jgi:hypothetical protein
LLLLDDNPLKVKVFEPSLIAPFVTADTIKR